MIVFGGRYRYRRTHFKKSEGVCADKTTLIVSHRISSIKHADLILVLEMEQIIHKGKHRELALKAGYYKI